MHLFRHADVAVLRAAPSPATAGPAWWPDPTVESAADRCREWLREVWSDTATADAVTLASPTLARRVGRICAGDGADDRVVRRATLSMVRYTLRQIGRPTPFGLFAGVAAAGFGPSAKVRWGQAHRALAQPDTQWLAAIIDRLESCPQLLPRLSVTVNSLRQSRGDRLVLSSAGVEVQLRHTAAVRAVERAAARPVRCADLAGTVAGRFAAADPAAVGDMLRELVARRFLLTGLRPPGTVIDPLEHVISQLRAATDGRAATLTEGLMRELRAVAATLRRHNEAGNGGQALRQLIDHMRNLEPTPRSPVTVDLWLDCDLTLPDPVAHEMEAAASALLRLSPQPAGPAAWRAYHAMFLDRYGVGTVVPLGDLADPGTGLGLPAGYPGSPFAPPPTPARSPRDDLLLALAMQAARDGRDEVVLDEDLVAALGGEFDPARVPPHVELYARVHAASVDALNRGEFTLAVTPARSAATMTGRFVYGIPSLARLLAVVPTSDADALPAQLSFPAAFPHADNICRTPRLLRHLIAVGEHRGPGDEGTIDLADLAVTADWHRLRLVSLSLGRPVEPQVLHALALDKQAPPLVRFLAALPRAHAATYTEFDWGAAAGLPRLPRVRYRGTVLTPARWLVNARDLPPACRPWPEWLAALARWRATWGLPGTVELRDDDRVLRLRLDLAAHAAVLRAHLDRTGRAVLTEAADPAGYGWLDGHAHEVVVPLVATRASAESPLARRPPTRVDGSGHGHLPGGPASRWLFAKVFVPPDRQDQALAGHLPRLLDDLGDPLWWFVRYRSATEPHQLRLRIAVAGPDRYGDCLAAVGAWVDRLRRAGLGGRLALDTYYPEVGRYGDGAATAAAEQVFAADSALVLAQLRHHSVSDPVAVTAADLVDIARGFCGGAEPGMAWLVDRGAPAGRTPLDRAVLREAVALAGSGRPRVARPQPNGTPLDVLRSRRADALTSYRKVLSSTMDRDEVLESLLHTHHIRALGIDRDGEHTCRRLARAAALAWQARTARR
jgi:thiopeptide-type bacteriocin biosynthesis protein